MTELEVEAVDAVEAPPDAPEYVLYGGKGGVGKTTMAAATALASARVGTPTLVVSTDPAHSLSDTFDAAVPPRPERLRENLWAAEIDPDDALADAAIFGEDGEVAGLGGLGDALGGEDAPDPFAGPMPGADEAAAMQQLLRFMDDDRFERVVVDTAPTGHTLRLLELPEIMDSMLGRIARLKQRLGGMLGGLLGDDEDDPSPDLDALRERVERLRAVLRDPDRTDFRIVTVPEEMSVREATRLRTRLREFGVPVGTIVVNRVMENLADVADVADADVVTPDLADCAFCQRRWQVQQAALGTAQELFREHEVRRVPLFADEVRGVAALRVVGACLAE